ncbi:MAG: metallophosphoesterase [Balneolaceae bacterium]|nr:MAG: metallophosphoesterase [Balneolaceae bacterium]
MILMENYENRFGVKTGALFILLLLFGTVSLHSQHLVSGIVFHDQNENGVYDSGEPGVTGVMVSNGSNIVRTDMHGRYEIMSEDESVIFVIKPRGWTTAHDSNNIPQFYSILSTAGAGGSDFEGLEPTGPLPETVNFALSPQEESDAFRVLVFGDTQPRTIEEINYIAHDTVQEVIGIDAAFGATLGDLVFDDLNLFEPLNQVIAQIGIPWRHVMGNHDIDFSADTNWDARGTYLRTYGPSWYAFTWGGAHFVAVDNIRWIVDGDDRYYRTGLGEEQFTFIENFLSEVPEDELVVFLMHIPWAGSTPWQDENERLRLFEVMAAHPHTISFAAHTHRHYHHFIGDEEGWPGLDTHHMVSMATVCGSWWTGAHDEYGIPHSMMTDGTPTGYGFLDISGTDWKFTFKAARRPAEFQMHISAPDEVSVSEAGSAWIYANIFNALPDANVEFRIGNSGDWMPMEYTEEPDPVYIAMREREHALENVSWRRAGNVNPNARHLWKANLQEYLGPGTYTIFVRSADQWHTYEGRRIIRITE